MKSFYIKSILMGIGIGIVFTALVGIIYSAGMSPQMSKEEIMERAKQYGMVMVSDTIISTEEDKGKRDSETILEDKTVPAYNNPVNNTKPAESENSKVDNAKPTENADMKEDNAKPTHEPVQEVKITIKYGDTSTDVAKKLYEAGLIEDADSFNNLIKNKNLSRSIQVGEFVIVKGTDEATIARIICKLR